MPSAFKRGPRTIPSTTAATAAASSKEPTTSASSSSSSSNAAAPPTTAPPHAQTWSARPTTHPSLRPSPFPSQLPLPLFSLGLDSINDVFTGVGLPSASLALFLPHQDGSDDEDERTRVGAAQGYADLMCKYAAAQGVAAGQRVLVVGEGVEEWMKGFLGWAGQDDKEGAMASKPEPAPSIPAAAAPQPPEEDKLKVAFRYEKLKRINDEAAEQAAASSSSSGSSTQPYVHPFDLSTRISSRLLQKAKEEGRLVVHSIADEEEDEEGRAGATDSSPRSRDSYSEAWEVIQRTVNRWQEESTSDESPLPARIILPSLGSPSWRIPAGRTHAGEAYRLLLRIKTLLRQTAWPSPQRQTQAAPAMPIIAISSPSAWLLLSGGSGADVAHRLSSLSDGALSFSSFSSDPRTRSLAESTTPTDPSASTSSSDKSSHFTGALRVLRTPAIGSLRGPSIRASALRGMASVSGAGGGGAGGEGGSSENALGFKVRRKGVKVDVMGRDLVANWGAGDKKEVKKAPPPADDETKGAAGGAHAASKSSRTAGAASVSVGIEEAPAAAAAAASTPTPAPAPAQMQQQPPDRTPLKGLAALRARGLAAQGADKGEQEGGAAPAKQKAVHGANHDW